MNTHTPAQETLLLKQPTVSQEHIAFLYASDIWIADRNGDNPRRLTVHLGVKSNPMFSPDGEWLAFSANYDGNTSIYVMSKNGGSPTRLTYHPNEDIMAGWSLDSQQIIFSTSRDTPTLRYTRLYTVAREGGFPEPLPMPMAMRGAYAPNNRQIAYTRIPEPFWSWKRYRGGRAVPIWIFDLDSYDYTEIPNESSNDTFPCWIDDKIYFLSDRHHTMNLFAYDTVSKETTQLTHHEDFDIRSLTAGDGLLAYEQGGRIHLFDPTSAETNTLHIHIAADLPYTRPHYQRASRFIRHAHISPTGVRAVFEARGDIFTVPAKKGDIRNITRTPDAHERFPAWSPDGRAIAYFSDANGEYELVLADQTGLEEKIFIPLGKKSFFYDPLWSPDGDKIAYTDKALNLYYINLETQEPILVDTDTYDHPHRSLDPSWSPDGKWLTYTKRLSTHMRAVFLYELASGISHQITDGMSDATDACFSPDGNFLYFAASSNYGLNTGWLDMSSFERPVTRNLYVIVLDKDNPSPFAPESDDEPLPNGPRPPQQTAAADEPQPPDTPGSTDEQEEEKPTPKTAEENSEPAIKIDLEGLDQRILALPVPAGPYYALQTADHKLFYLEAQPQSINDNGPRLSILKQFDLKERSSEVFRNDIRNYWLSANGQKILLLGQYNANFAIVSSDKNQKSENGGSLNFSQMEVYVDPRAEWAQMYEETGRIQRDFFYDAHMHGVDWEAMRAKYRPFLQHVGHRHDLNFIFAELLGELVVGHAYVRYGDIPSPNYVPGGLLGADYELVDGYYRIKKIYTGLNWYPELHAPLTQPGINVAEGEYILAVNGRPLQASTNIYSLFEKTAGRITKLLVSPTTNPADGRMVTVEPIVSETQLRHWSWVEGNRHKVNELSGGRLAYVYMPDTSVDGYTAFNRYYFSQLDKDGVILDERFNGGGSVADYVIDLLDRPLLSYWATREGQDFATPNASIFGPKVMITNEYSASGGDAMPQFFRRRNLGKIVGKRTWGGLVGIYDNPILMDGGVVTAPRMAIYSPDGEWEVENEGVYPDIEVEMEPKAVIAGEDPQLEKAVEVALEELEKNPPPRPKRPAPAHRVRYL